MITPNILMTTSKVLTRVKIPTATTTPLMRPEVVIKSRQFFRNVASKETKAGLLKSDVFLK